MKSSLVASETKAVRLRIEGVVQGVGFRAWVERSARARGLDGWVRNRRDGGVEAVIAGEAGRVDDMIKACHSGPTCARVDMVKILDEPCPVPAGFAVVATF